MTTTRKRQQRLHHSLRNIIYRENGIFNVDRLKHELQHNETPFDNRDELAQMAQALKPTLSTLIWATFFIVSFIVFSSWFLLSFMLKVDVFRSLLQIDAFISRYLHQQQHDDHHHHHSSGGHYGNDMHKVLLAHVLRFMTNDWYYFIAVPISLPIFMWLIYFNWLYMNFFKHN